MRGATSLTGQGAKDFKFQSTLLMRGATIRSSARSDSVSHFNPRSSCEERRARQISYWISRDFNPRSSCEERPRGVFRQLGNQFRFQSTLLMRGATIDSDDAFLLLRFQSTLLMRGATLQHMYPVTLFGFQSTLLMRGATRPGYGSCNNVTQISIHAPHARSDLNR